VQPSSDGTRHAPVRRNVFRLLVLALVVLAASGIFWWRAKSRKAQYVTAAVTRGSIQRSVTTTGALNPLVTVQVGSYVSGTIKALGCDYNTEVVVGQVCAVVDPLPFQLIVDQDKAAVGVAEAQLNKDKAALVYAKGAFERDAKLLAEGSVSQDTVDSEKSTLDQMVATIALDQASIVNKVATLKAAQVNLDYTRIVSPVVGTVITRAIDVGQTVAASLSSPTLFLIGKDLTKMQVDTNVSEADVGAVRVGQDAFFTVQAYPGRTFRGKVMMIRHGPITVQNVVTYDVVVAVENPDRALFPGMTADTHIVLDEHGDVLRVPLPAVRFNPEGIARSRGDRARTQEAAVAPTPAGSSPGTGAGEGGPASTSAGTAARPEGARESRSARPEGRAEGRPERRAEGGPGRRPEGATAGAGTGRPGGGERWGEARSAGASARKSRVWVLSADGTLRPVEVTTGLDDGALIEVSGEGLAPGDKVVVNQIVPGDQGRSGAGANPAFRPGQGQGQGQGAGPGGPRL
jgi:HlyD family secretion protein